MLIYTEKQYSYLSCAVTHHSCINKSEFVLLMIMALDIYNLIARYKSQLTDLESKLNSVFFKNQLIPVIWQLSTIKNLNLQVLQLINQLSSHQVLDDLGHVVNGILRFGFVANDSKAWRKNEAS